MLTPLFNNFSVPEVENKFEGGPCKGSGKKKKKGSFFLRNAGAPFSLPIRKKGEKEEKGWQNKELHPLIWSHFNASVVGTGPFKNRRSLYTA